MPSDLLAVGPGDAGWENAVAWSPDERSLLAPDHPFLAFGAWRAFAAVERGVVRARLVASIDPRQRTALGQVGCIGFIDLGAAGAGGGAGADGGRTPAERVLEAAIEWLRGRGACVVRGPVQLSTWYGHRAMTGDLPDEGGLATFPLEPRGGRAVVDLLASSGFDPAHRAVSFVARSDAVIETAGAVLDRVRAAGLHDRPVQPEKIDVELGLLHRLSTEIFRDNWGFSEISPAEFGDLYRPSAQLTDLELVRIVSDAGGRPLGFVFALPMTPTSGGPGFVVKTLGLLPAARRRFPGSGAALTALIHRTAVGRGHRDAVHALMEEASAAHRLSLRWGPRIRSYATFERAIG